MKRREKRARSILPKFSRSFCFYLPICLLFGGIFCPPTSAHLFPCHLPGIAPDPAGIDSPVPTGPLPWRHPFVRHQHLKMSNHFQRVRPGSLPFFPFSFFNSSCCCPSRKLPLSPWGWRRAVSLFPSQTSVSINSCVLRAPPPSGQGLERKCFVYLEGSISSLTPLGVGPGAGRLLPWTLEALGMWPALASPLEPAFHSGISRLRVCFASWVVLRRLLSLSEFLLPFEAGILKAGSPRQVLR